MYLYVPCLNGICFICYIGNASVWGLSRVYSLDCQVCHIDIFVFCSCTWLFLLDNRVCTFLNPPLGSYTRIFLLKVNSVQEACAKCFAFHILKFEILQITWKKWNKEHQTLSFQFFINKSILMFSLLIFHVVCKISNFDMWTAKHLAQASCTELTLSLKQHYSK